MGNVSRPTYFINSYIREPQRHLLKHVVLSWLPRNDTTRGMLCANNGWAPHVWSQRKKAIHNFESAGKRVCSRIYGTSWNTVCFQANSECTITTTFQKMCGIANDNTAYKIDAGTGARMRTYTPTLRHACVLDHIFNRENPFSYII